jgi:zinc transport system substrate-binding protein
MRAILTIKNETLSPSLVGAVVLLVLAGPGCGGSKQPSDGRLQIVASFYPLAEAARQVGGACTDVIDLAPPGVEPHDMELDPDALEAIASADVVVYLGAGFQPAIEQGVHEASGVVLDALQGQPRLRTSDDSATDPHVWLDPARYELIVDRIAAALDRAGAPDSCDLEGHAAAYRDQLTLLDAEFATGLETCRADVIVTTHAAFGYLADAYGLRQEAISGLAPESEPDARRLAELRDFLLREGVSTVFTEELVPPDVANTLASEVGARTVVLRTIETKPELGDYVTAMRQNLRALRSALGCS